MTTAIRTRIGHLDLKFSKLIDQLTEQRMGGMRPPELPEPQVIALGLSGRILTAAHIKVSAAEK
jgi:hypothetical protein